MPPVAFLTDTLALIKRFLVDSGGEIAAADQIEEISYVLPRADYREVTTVEEGGVIQPVDIASTADDILPIKWFTDGIQKTFLVGTFDLGEHQIAIHYAIVAAIIVKYEKDRWSMFSQPVVREYALTSSRLLGMDLPEGFTDTGAEKGYFSDQRMDAVRRVRALRHELESEHLSEWLTATDESERILVDGSLAHLPMAADRAVGVCKDNHPRFFESEVSRSVLGLGYGERSSLFTYETPLGKRITSWFMRIRQPVGQAATFGLIRPELMSDGVIGPEEVSAVSRAVFNLRNPVAYPAPKWERLIYPLRVCTEFLNNHLPKVQTLKHFLHGAIVA